MLSRQLGYFLFLLATQQASAAISPLLGFEDLGHEPSGNHHQIWGGVELDSAKTVVGPLTPHGRIMFGMVDKGAVIVTAGLAYTFRPLTSVPDLSLSVQTGPSYTDVGEPHTSSKFDWTSDLRLQYKYLTVGYSHTSNGGISEINSGLDMVIIGIVIPLESFSIRR